MQTAFSSFYPAVCPDSPPIMQTAFSSFYSAVCILCVRVVVRGVRWFGEWS